ncbi:MAG: ABC transporter ATP-binding protein [Candidatus Latescibacteria bacterium]|jgi:ABC-2 type transport system ATP-binding protein|nr:ABC transporter ATP-binding protein [Candidatus Latescibacterota bacterium]
MMVDIRDVWKRYPGSWALRGLSLEVDRGRVLGVLGENGSGKSTLFRILAGVTRPSRGEVSIEGLTVGVETKRIVSYLPEIDPFYAWMRVSETLEFLSAFYAGWDGTKADELLSFMGLEGDRKVGELSRGQRGRLKVVFAFSWPSTLVLMDEPLGGIDPPSRKRILNGLFNEFRVGEQTIILSTHLVSEVEEFVEDVLYLHDGEAVLAGNADQLREERSKSLSDIFEEVAA